MDREQHVRAAGRVTETRARTAARSAASACRGTSSTRGSRATARWDTAANSGQGGNGGAIDNDGDEIVLNITSTLIENNHANEGGSAVFFVSNDKSGSVAIQDSITRNNPKGTFETDGFPGFFVQAKQDPTVTNSQILL